MKLGSAFLGIAVVLLGVLLLLDSLAVLPFNWGIAVAVLLLAFGAALLWSRRHRPAEVQRAGSRTRISLDGAAQATLTLQHGSGRLLVRGGTEPDLLFDGAFGGGLELQTGRHGDRVDAELRHKRAAAQSASDAETASKLLDWNVSFTDAVPLTMHIRKGSGGAELDLSRLRLSELDVRLGGGTVELKLPGHAGHTAVRLDAGAASVDVLVPDTAAARIRVDGLGSITVDAERFPRRGGSNESPEFDRAINALDIRIGVGSGSVTVH